jgi:hypothetical protein
MDDLLAAVRIIHLLITSKKETDFLEPLAQVYTRPARASAPD